MDNVKKEENIYTIVMNQLVTQLLPIYNLWSKDYSAAQTLQVTNRIRVSFPAHLPHVGFSHTWQTVLVAF